MREIVAGGKPHGFGRFLTKGEQLPLCFVTRREAVSIFENTSHPHLDTAALAILDVAVSDINEMKAAMWRIIGSAPAGTDPARLLRLTITRLGSR